MFKSGSYRSHPEHTALYDALELSMDRENREEFNEATAKSRKRRRVVQDPPLPSPKDFDQSKKKGHDSDASASKQHPVQKSSAWKTSDTREGPSRSSKKKYASPFEQPIDDIPILYDVHLSDSKDTSAAHLSKIKTKPGLLQPVLEEETLETPEPDWVIPPNNLPETKNNWANAIAKTYQDLEENKLFWKTGDMGSFIKWYCKQTRKSKLVKSDLEGDKERRNALSISKLKEAYNLDFELKEFVPSLWIESERDYDISAAYVRSHMRILIVVSLKTYSKYGYTFSKEIVLRKADYKEYKISEADFKNLHPNDFEDLYLLHLQGKLNRLSRAEKSYQTKLNLTQLRWDATDFIFKKDYTIVHKPKAVIYRDRNNQKKMMRKTDVHKFSDGTLTRILEKLDFMVKDYELFKFNPGMDHRIWSEDDK
ncbi:hypothetical protein Tco_0381588 [Tanacetum coccineum]